MSVEREGTPSSPPITHQEFMAMRPRSDSSDNRRIVASAVQRSATQVFGVDLAAQAESAMRLRDSLITGAFSPKGLLVSDRGERIIALQYAPSVTAVAASFGWGETDPHMLLVSARLYEHEVGVQKQRLTALQHAPSVAAVAASFGWGETDPHLYEHAVEVQKQRLTDRGETSNLELLQEKLRTAIATYALDHADVISIDIDVLMRFFTAKISSRIRPSLRDMLRKGRTEAFLKALDAK